MRALCVVPARKGSERFPRKHHASILGKPLFAYTLEAALASKSFDRVVVSTDDLELRPLVERYGVLFLERPAELALATSALDDAVRHVCRTLEVREHFVPEVVVVMQGNVPIRKPGQIEEAIRRLESLPDATAVCTAQQVRVRPEWAKVIVDEGTGKVAPYSPGDHPYRKQEFPKLYVLDGAILAVRREVLFATEGNRAAHAWLGSGLHILPQPHAMYSIEVDYPDEVPLVEYYIQRTGKGEG